MPTKNEGSVLLTRLIQRPLLLQVGSEELFTQSVMEMQHHEQYGDAVSVNRMQGDDFWDDDDPFVSMVRPYSVEGGVLTIPVKGVLMNRMSITFEDYATGYGYIEAAYERGLNDPDVKAIAFDIDSPGGEVAGNFELVEAMMSRRGEKPTTAYASDHAYSAAYSIATAADQIVVTRSGGVGSVGVVTAHMDMSERASKMGVKVTFIYAGAHKVDGNPYQPLPDDVKARIQDKIDRIYGEFVGIVATNRGMEESAVRGTEALTYDATEAVAIGFADRVGAITELAASEEVETETYPMALKTNTPVAGSEGGQITQEQLTAATEEARASGVIEGASAERDRINAIIGSDEGAKRPKAAKSAALKTEMTAEQATAFLADLPEEAVSPAPVAPEAAAPAPVAPEAAAPAPTPFASHMSGPDVGANVDAPKADGPATPSTLLGSYAMLTGRDLRPTS